MVLTLSTLHTVLGLTNCNKECYNKEISGERVKHGFLDLILFWISQTVIKSVIIKKLVVKGLNMVFWISYCSGSHKL